ncbi:MAG: 4Fe-4S dicluster domain-containing protein [Candidatus Aminicenantes bacterium]|nr:4Fe-4S dicluster domain-containing protein [Candidatus Aminicenantes bacterium]
MEKILQKRDLSDWVKKLNEYTIMAPVEKENHWEYEVLKDPSRINLEYKNTILSPKKVIFPQREVFFEFGTHKENNVLLEEKLPEDNPVVIFGVRPCDARALTLTDKVFSGDIKDPYYWKRRSSTILVGLGCITPPSKNCFCTSVGGSPFSTDGLDILLTETGDLYFVECLTKKGEALINGNSNLFKDPREKDRSKLQKIKSQSEKKIKRRINNIEDIPKKLKKMFDSEFWDTESLSCIRCGICTYLCPTCHCFDINDEVDSHFPLKGKRVRTWDNCQFPDFTMHSSGHNPRPDKASRLRQRVLHKFQYFVQQYNRYQCTGCGRCVSECPVGIDIIELLNKVNEDEIQ